MGKRQVARRRMSVLSNGLHGSSFHVKQSPWRASKGAARVCVWRDAAELARLGLVKSPAARRRRAPEAFERD